ncbi:unnamed protein product, partial [Rangifer tarandus platyrhynchus]
PVDTTGSPVLCFLDTLAPGEPVHPGPPPAASPRPAPPPSTPPPHSHRLPSRPPTRSDAQPFSLSSRCP